jgi:flagellar basal-body rod modification protein FlgD
MSITDTITQITSNTNKINFEKGQQNLGKTTLNKDAFMQLLLAKLQNQDPLNPEDNGEFLTQQAQLAQVEQMDNLNKTMQSTSLLTQASSMVGKTVDIDRGENMEPLKGKIESATISSNGEVSILVNGDAYKMSDVRKIYGDAT